MKSLQIRKFHGCSNDFVLIEDYKAEFGQAGSLSSNLIVALCDRRGGVGADGVIRIIGRDADAEVQSTDCDLRMDFYNADGGASEMCGNGIRCLAVLAHRNGMIGTEARILTGAGVKPVTVLEDGHVKVDMGTPGLDRADVPMAGVGSAVDVGVDVDGSGTVVGTGVSMGNPHFVIFTDHQALSLDHYSVHGLGPALEIHPAFPARTNVEFVTVRDKNRATVRVWERGVGETQACGTGACAVAVAGALTGRTGRHVSVELPGGVLDVEWTKSGTVMMTGPTQEVFSASIARDLLEKADK